MKFEKYVKVNTRDLRLAIHEAMHPMCEWYDWNHDGLPYFANVVTQEGFGNFHHTSWSAGHCAPRWMESMYRALKVGEKWEPSIYQNLKKWVYRVYDNGIGLPANIDTETFELKKESDICNLRESFYGLACIYLCEKDPRALEIAGQVIRTVDAYLDRAAGEWNDEKYFRERGAHAVGLFTGDWEKPRFCNTFGRFIGGLTVLYQATGLPQALRLALEIANIALHTVVKPDGSFDPNETAPHVYSTSSMLSAIAFLAAVTQDHQLYDRLDAFMKNGYYQVALNCGWVCENVGRTVLNGEINDSCDLLEVCLELGKAGYEGYFARAEKMMRGHILPSQLLDTHFISDAPDADASKDHMASRVKGAFGFPCPYGHEYEPGSLISFNWDIVGGVSGLCRAYETAVTRLDSGIVSVNLLFDYEDDGIKVTSPYGCGDTLGLCVKESVPVRVRLPQNVDTDKVRAAGAGLGVEHAILGEWLYLTNPVPGQWLRIAMPMVEKVEKCRFLGHDLAFKWRGEEIVAASSQGKRLCFFPEMDP